jgi:hypothetical protein
MTSSSDPMIKAKALLEGMWAGDLNDLLLPTVSIDEYASKVDNNAIVVGFFVHDIDAANDLNRFIQKTTVDILYSEVSPAPDQRGYYIVFIELLDNAKLIDNICELIEEVTFLTNVDEWSANILGVNKPIKVSPDTLDQALKLARKTDVVQTAKRNKERTVDVVSRIDHLKKKLRSAAKRLSESSLDSFEIRSGNLVLTSRNKTTEYELVDVQNLSSLDIGAVSMDFNSLKECRAIAMDLGEGWDVCKVNDTYAMHLMENNVVITVRPTE